MSKVKNPDDREKWSKRAQQILGSWGVGKVVAEADWMEVDLTDEFVSRWALMNVLDSLEEHARDDD